MPNQCIAGAGLRLARWTATRHRPEQNCAPARFGVNGLPLRSHSGFLQVISMPVTLELIVAAGSRLVPSVQAFIR
jgi:hypothetical protein